MQSFPNEVEFETTGCMEISVSLIQRLVAIFLQQLVSTIYLFIQISGGKIGQVTVTVEVFPTYGKNILSKYLSYLSSDVLSSLQMWLNKPDYCLHSHIHLFQINIKYWWFQIQITFTWLLVQFTEQRPVTLSVSLRTQTGLRCPLFKS